MTTDCYGVSSCGRRFLKPAAVLLFCFGGLIFAVAGCEKSVSTPRLAHAAVSKEALAEDVLRSIRDGDLQRMKDLSLSKDEFQRFVWPELPVSNPKTNVPLDYVWNDVHYRSTSRMQASFNKLKGKDLKLVRVVHNGELVEYKSHRAYSDMEVIVREPNGQETPYPLFGTLIEMNGRWKVYSYAPYD